MQSNLSVKEIQAVAESAITTRSAADAAKKALDKAPDDANLKSAYETAEAAAKEAKTKVDALSQEDNTPGKKKQAEKIRRKIGYLKNDLRNLGEDDDDEELDDADLDMGDIDPDKPLTLRDMQRIEARKASQSARQKAQAITDPIAREAVIAALTRIVPSGDPERDFSDAVTIASREKNSKILEEISRKVTAPQHRNGAGSPPPEEEGAFVPTAEEASFMRPPFNLSKDAIIAARKQGQK